MDNGIQHAKKAVTEDLQFYNMFEEWIDCTLDGGVQCNTATIYNFGNKNHEDVRSAVARMRQDGMVCNRCISKGQQLTCKVESLGACCSDCEADPTCTPEDPCMCQYTVHVFSDQGSEQRKALGEMHVDNIKLGLSSDYFQLGFGLLHGNKNITGALRNYRLTDGMTGSFCVTDLIAVACSDTDIARKLVAATSVEVFQYKDRHSDHTCYLTSCSEVQELYEQCEYVKAQELPNCYRPWTALANNHNLLRRPHYLATNSRGDRFFTEVENHCIGMYNCHNPPKFKIICGIWNHPGKPQGQCNSPSRCGSLACCVGKPKQGMGLESQMRFGGQLALLVIQPGKEEYMYFADVGNGIIRRLSGVHSYDAPHCVNTVLLHNSNGDHRPMPAYSAVPSPPNAL